MVGARKVGGWAERVMSCGHLQHFEPQLAEQHLAIEHLCFARRRICCPVSRRRRRP